MGSYNSAAQIGPTSIVGMKIRGESKQVFNPLNANPTKWSNTLKQFVGNLSTNFFSVFDHFGRVMALKGKHCG